MTAHETSSDEFHLNMAMDKIATMEKSLTSRQLVIFRLDNFKKMKSENDAYYSPTFYTGPCGYRLGIKVLPNGYGDGYSTNLAVFALVLKGDYDRDLKWPFIGTIACTLCNQLKDRGHHTGLVHFTHVGNRVPGSSWGFEKFIPHSVLAGNESKDVQYLKDDALYFRVSVQVGDLKTWLQCTAV
jgi:TNF receptor-associated factor 4